jgi:hypothetical protein
MIHATSRIAVQAHTSITRTLKRALYIAGMAMITFMSRLSAGIVIAAAAGAIGVAQHTPAPTWSPATVP